MTLVMILISVTCLAYANGANDNFKGVATLSGSGTTNYRWTITWATITTFLGSTTAIFFAETLLTRFSGKGLVASDLASNVNSGVAVATGAGLTVLLATRFGILYHAQFGRSVNRNGMGRRISRTFENTR